MIKFIIFKKVPIQTSWLSTADEGLLLLLTRASSHPDGSNDLSLTAAELAEVTSVQRVQKLILTIWIMNSMQTNIKIK